MAAFCGINYEDAKSKIELTCVWADGANVREGIELQTAMVKKIENGQSVRFCGETFRSRDGSVRIQLADGTGYTSLFSMEGSAFFNAPPTPSVQSSLSPTLVTFVTVNARSYRYLAAYRAALLKLGFVGGVEPLTLPATLTFTNSAGTPLQALQAAFDLIQAAHLAKDYDFPKSEKSRSVEWWKFELWMQYKKEISIWAD